MADVKSLDDMRIIAFSAIVLWLCALVMFFLSKSRIEPPTSNGNDKILRLTKKTLTRCKYYIPLISLLALIFYLLKQYYIAFILIAFLSIILPAYYITIYTKHFLEKSSPGGEK
jgi:quinol-cytochrome oxidoreductase complex cytochrome b subunit